MTTATPPVSAQDLLALVTSARDRDGVLGDLLEEYSETILPARGQPAANRWYWRQVWSFVWRASSPAGATVGGCLCARLLLDITTPTALPATRQMLTACLALTMFALWGFLTGRRTGRTGSGTVVAVCATILATAQVMVMALLVAGIAGPWIRPHPAAWAGLREGFDQPLVPMLLLGGTIASLGAALGKRWTGPRASIRA